MVENVTDIEILVLAPGVHGISKSAPPAFPTLTASTRLFQ